MTRYNPTDRIGVNATESIFISEFDWIFREQTIVDVGIDALVEQSTNGDPKGKFVALQIKSGKGNFYISKKGLTYYISNVHYNYWLNFDIPVILVAHLPKRKETYWREIKKENIEKKNRSWKLEISFDDKLDVSAKPSLEKILTKNQTEYQFIKIFNGEKLNEGSIFHLAEKSNCIRDSIVSLSKVSELIQELGTKNAECNVKITEFNRIGQSLRSPEAEAVIWRLSKDMVIISKRLENENQIFAETFAEALFGHQQLIKAYHILFNDSREHISSIEALQNLPDKIDFTINNMSSMNKSLKAFPDVFPELKNAKNIMIDVIDNIISEFNDAKYMIIKVTESFTE